MRGAGAVARGGLMYMVIASSFFETRQFYRPARARLDRIGRAPRGATNHPACVLDAPLPVGMSRGLIRA